MLRERGGGGSIQPTNRPVFGALSHCVLVENCFVGEREVLCEGNNRKRTFNVVRQCSSNIRRTREVNMCCVTVTCNTMAEGKKTSALFYPETFLEGTRFHLNYLKKDHSIVNTNTCTTSSQVKIY